LGLIKPLQTKEEKKYRKKRSVVSDIKFIKEERENITALKSTMQCPFVLLVKVVGGKVGHWKVKKVK
jgi:hypothetical protein